LDLSLHAPTSSTVIEALEEKEPQFRTLNAMEGIRVIGIPKEHNRG
jgi:hypothetical protein